jgi:hypothetical protein
MAAAAAEAEVVVVVATRLATVAASTVADVSAVSERGAERAVPPRVLS